MHIRPYCILLLCSQNHCHCTHLYLCHSSTEARGAMSVGQEWTKLALFFSNETRWNPGEAGSDRDSWSELACAAIMCNHWRWPPWRTQLVVIQLRNMIKTSLPAIMLVWMVWNALCLKLSICNSSLSLFAIQSFIWNFLALPNWYGDFSYSTDGACLVISDQFHHCVTAEDHLNTTVIN